MGEVREMAGVASALLGFSQFSLGALVSPLVGLGGQDTAVVPAAVMAVCSLTASSVFLRRVLRRRRPAG
jgi:DHA1 family bicyclomycin/chloramphenicol resistance-like MFS transporter